MIVALLLALQAVPAPAPAPEDDIVVIGERLQRDFKASIRFRKDGPECKVAKSTGDAEIDRIGCAAMTTCFPQFQSRYQATSARGIKASTRKVMQAALNSELTQCVSREHSTRTAELSAKRRAARAGS